ncbi:MAG TPA: DinB family protein [Thermoanaerobaculaceae bacterium]|nr:DinB family protein [Thermoanaerobaculaceae bacterium]
MSGYDQSTGGNGEEALEPELAELADRLAGDLAAVLGAVSRLTQAQADWRPAPDRWSVGEVLHHLAISNRLFAVVARKLTQKGHREGLVPAPGSRRSWPRSRWLSDASASGPVKNPDSATPTAGLPVDDLRRELEATHLAVQGQIPALAGLDLDALRMQHPLGFELNVFRWVDLAGAHERRHLAQIEAIMAAPGFPPS